MKTLTPKLRPVKHDLSTVCWCGPAALSIITGHPTSRTMALLRTLTGKPVIKGVSWAIMLEAIRRYGLTHQAWHPSLMADGREPTLARWLRERQDKSALYLVRITGHYLVVQGRRICDNRTKDPVFLRQYALRRARVKNAWRIA